MAKNKKSLKRASGAEFIEETKFILRDRVFNMWINKFQFVGDEIDYRKNRFILKKLYHDGCIGAFKSKLDTLEFAPFAVRGYDLYDYPVKLQFINNRNSPLIPVKEFKIDEENGAVICYVLPSWNAPEETCEWYIEQIALTEAVIRTNLFTQNMPFLIATSPADKEKIKEILKRVLDCDIAVSADFNDIEKIKILNGGATYIIDKLNKYKTDLWNELLTYLGVNNTGVEKQERMLKDEVNANNQEIEESADSFLTQMENFCERIKKYLGFEISVELNEVSYEPLNIDETQAGKHDKEEKENDGE